MTATAPPTIAHVLHRMDFAGAEVLAADLSRRLGDRYRFVFFCLDGVGTLGKQLQAEGWTVIDLGRKPGLDLGCARRLRQASREHNVAMLHAHQYTPFFYAAASRGCCGLPLGLGPGSRTPRILFTEHGRHYPDERRPKRIFANRFLLKPTDRVSAVGHYVKDLVAANEGIAAERIEVIHNGIDPAAFCVAESQEDRAAQRKAARDAMGLSDADAVVMQVARFHPVKDHATSIRAFAKAHAETPNAVLVLVGDGTERDAAVALTEELGITDSVRFLGVRDDVGKLLPGADVFVLSSLSEGISVTLLEAMGTRLPIAATDVGGNPEVVAHDETGLLSPRGGVEAMAANLTALLQDPAKRAAMGDAGHARLMEQFTQARMHAGYEEVYGKMTGNF